MKVEKIRPGSEIASYNLDGTQLTIDGGTAGTVTVDLAEVEQDSQALVTVTRHDDQLVLGNDGKNGYVADVEIPPRRYEMVDSGETDIDGNPVYTRTPVPIDTELVTLKLWPLTITENEEGGA